MAECPSCGAPVEPGQEYCLECGARVPAERGLAARIGRSWRRRLRWYPGDWLPIVLALLVIAALAAAAAVYAAREDDGTATGRTVVATAPPDTTQEQTTAETTTEPVASVPTETTATTTTTTTEDGAGPGAPVEWPADEDAFTVVLASMPVSGGRELALQNARRAIRGGLDEVGVLDSEDYASLHPGFYVVFAGVYGSLEEAESAVPDARDQGFANAYAREITH